MLTGRAEWLTPILIALLLTLGACGVRQAAPDSATQSDGVRTPATAPKPDVAGGLGATKIQEAEVSPPPPGYEIVSNQVNIPAGSVANATVTCPSGEKVLGGGFDIPVPGFVQVFSSEPSDGVGTLSDHQWNVLAHNVGPVSYPITVIAICASGNLTAGHQIGSYPVVVQASSTANVTAICSSGSKVTGGGFSVEPPSSVRVLSSSPTDGLNAISDHEWNVVAQNAHLVNSRQVTASAICVSAANPIPGYQIVSNQVLVPPAGAADVTATCSSGTRVLGGGFQTGSSLVQVLSSKPSHGGTISDRHWNVLAQNADVLSAQPVTVRAICSG